MITDVLFLVTARHFCAGLVLEDGVVTTAAPILKYMVGWNLDRVRNYCQQKGWRLS